MKRLVLLLLIALVVAGCTKEKKESGSAPAVTGNPALDFSLSGPAGDTRLSALKGNLLLVHFWATWCPPCREELPSLAKLNSQMAGKPFRLLAISIDKDGNPAVQKLFGQLGITLPVLLDPSSEVAKQYGITGVPETFIISPAGEILKKIVGPMEWTSPEVLAYLTDAMKPAK
jgi:thiol-disulfide isomerase/thioredoxin